MAVRVLDALRSEVARRLDAARLAHVQSVVDTARALAAAGGWPAGTVDAVERAAWYHDARKPDGVDAWLAAIEETGEAPDSWALAHAPQLLHAQAAAVWATSRGELDREVLEAVRHHPTGYADWGAVGRLLFVADFCEPTRAFAAEAGTASLLSIAADGRTGLRESARRVLRLRMGWLIHRGVPVHPESMRAWKAWLSRATP